MSQTVTIPYFFQTYAILLTSLTGRSLKAAGKDCVMLVPNLLPTHITTCIIASSRLLFFREEHLKHC